MSKNERKLIIKGHDKNLLIKFWNWGWGIYYNNPEFWNYVIVGLCTTIVSLILKYVLLFFIFDSTVAIELQASIIISWIGAVLFAYITNRIFVFKSKSKNVIGEITSFFGGRLMTLFMEMVFMWFFVTLLGLNTDMWVIIFTIICQVFITLANYFISKFLVFKK